MVTHFAIVNHLSQFGLFLNNDILFITVHYNDMIDIIGRKLMVGDVLELPHLLDYNPLDEKIPVALKRYMQITDSNYASEGFTQTWYPHLWRIKCEPLVNSEEFADILNAPINQDNYLGDFDPNKTYPPGYTVTYGGIIYESTTNVPPGVTPPDAAYWKPIDNGSLADILSTYNKNTFICFNFIYARRLIGSFYCFRWLFILRRLGSGTYTNLLSLRFMGWRK